MEELRLTRPTEAMSGEISAYRQAMLDAGSEMDGCGPLSRMEDPAEWIAFCKTLDEGTNVPERWVPATQFVCLRGAKIAGMIQVRRELNDYLRNYAGHIGYSVRPDERQQGIATWMLHNVLTYCREIGLKRVMVACEPWNVGRRKTILRNGGVYEKTVHEDGENIDLEHYWISLT